MQYTIKGWIMEQLQYRDLKAGACRTIVHTCFRLEWGYILASCNFVVVDWPNDQWPTSPIILLEVVRQETLNTTLPLLTVLMTSLVERDSQSCEVSLWCSLHVQWHWLPHPSWATMMENGADTETTSDTDWWIVCLGKYFGWLVTMFPWSHVMIQLLRPGIPFLFGASQDTMWHKTALIFHKTLYFVLLCSFLDLGKVRRVSVS